MKPIKHVIYIDFSVIVRGLIILMVIIIIIIILSKKTMIGKCTYLLRL